MKAYWMLIESFIKDYWPIIAFALGGLIWAVRMEGQVREVKNGIMALWKRRKEDQDGAEKSRSEVHELLTELRLDVKKLLAQGDSRK